MSVTVSVPKLASDTSGGIVAEWYEEDGATVSTGQPIFRLERDFIAFDVEAEGDGILQHRAKVGEFFFAGAIVASIQEIEAGSVEVVRAQEPIAFPGVDDTVEDSPSRAEAGPVSPEAEEEPLAPAETSLETSWEDDEDFLEPTAWDEQPREEGFAKPVSLNLPTPAQPGRSMWDDAIAASSESEMDGGWGFFDDATEAVGRDHSLAETSHSADEDYRDDGLFEPAPDVPIEGSVSDTSWGETLDDDDDYDSASLLDAPRAGGGFAWDADDTGEEAEEPALEPVFETDEYGSAEDTEQREQAEALAPEPVFDATAEFDSGADDPQEALDASIEHAELDPQDSFHLIDASTADLEFEAECEYETPVAEAFEPEEEPAVEVFDSAETVEAEIEGLPFETEPLSVPVVMHMATDIEVAPYLVEDTEAFTATLTTAVELVVDQTWDDYKPTISLVDSGSSGGPGPEDVVVYDFASFGIERAEAPLNGEAPVAFAIGSTIEHVSFSGQAIGVSNRASLSMSYDATRVNELEAARLLASVREVVEAKDGSVAA